MPFGVSSAPSIFQRIMDSVLQGIPKVIVYIDDILITGSTDKEHLETLEKVLYLNLHQQVQYRIDWGMMNVIKNFKSRREGQRRNGSLISLQQSNDNTKIYVFMLVSCH